MPALDDLPAPGNLAIMPDQPAPAAQDPSHEYTVRAPHYAILESSQTCWKCHGSTPVFGFILPPGHEALWVDDDAELDEWESVDGSSSLVSSIARMHPDVFASIQALTSRYGLSRSNAGGRYFMNFCVHCNAKQGDFFLYSEPGGAFFPMTQADADAIRATLVDRPFSASGSTGYGTPCDMIAEHIWWSKPTSLHTHAEMGG